MKKSLNPFALAIFPIYVLVLGACSPGFEPKTGSIAPSIPQAVDNSQEDASPAFCSNLSFKGVKWSASLSGKARRSLAVAMSLTGSYEGADGWQNLTNNFDGQGMSAGLLNQTLGTGSLEPLLASMLIEHREVFASDFSHSDFDSFSGMIQKWMQAVGWKDNSPAVLSARATMMAAAIRTRQDFSQAVQESTAENLMSNPILMQAAVTASPNQSAVQWAVSTLYNNSGNFTNQWKSELMKFYGETDYVSLQVGAATSLHNQAVSYLAKVGSSDLRTYLLMFDIVVQDGGISSAEWKEWQASVASQRLQDANSRLKALVQILLTRVIPKYRNDVKSRKYAIIDGTGFVHGQNRNLPKEYCYQASDPAL